MKAFFYLILGMIGVVLSGCVTGRSGLVLDTVGPAMSTPSTVNSSNGTLVVYSAYDVNASFINRNSKSPVYSDYKILAADGRLLQRVRNNSGTILQDPVLVGLPSGKYQVIALANGYGRVMVPVSVEAGCRTILHLEGGGFWPDESAFNQTNAVCLPDGVIIGWRANPGSPSLNH